jgi:hypothetical protein
MKACILFSARDARETLPQRGSTFCRLMNIAGRWHLRCLRPAGFRHVPLAALRYILSASGPELGVPDCRGPLMCERSMLPMRHHAFAEPAPINHTDHHRWRDPERVLRFEACPGAGAYGFSRRCIDSRCWGGGFCPRHLCLVLGRLQLAAPKKNPLRWEAGQVIALLRKRRRRLHRTYRARNISPCDGWARDERALRVLIASFCM